jgi:Arc/MetJ family transcription regulator
MTMATIATKTQPSFYYTLIAQTCLQRSRATVDQARCHALREAARDYLAKARAETAGFDTQRNAA